MIASWHDRCSSDALVPAQPPPLLSPLLRTLLEQSPKATRQRVAELLVDLMAIASVVTIVVLAMALTYMQTSVPAAPSGAEVPRSTYAAPD